LIARAKFLCVFGDKTLPPNPNTHTAAPGRGEPKGERRHTGKKRVRYETIASVKNDKTGL
jgi:hypothetical protein